MRIEDDDIIAAIDIITVSNGSNGWTMGGLDIDDMAGFVVGFRNGVMACRGRSVAAIWTFFWVARIVVGAAVYELVALGFLMDRKIGAPRWLRG